MEEQENAWRALRGATKDTTRVIASILNVAKRLTKGQRLLLERTLEHLEWHVDGTYSEVRQNRRDREASEWLHISLPE